jgi:hypothetical protein
MYQFIHLHLAISEKLWWGDMLSFIALPAIQQILENAAEQCSAQIEEPVGYKHIEDDILAMSADDLFCCLLPDDCYTPKDKHDFECMRFEIEYDMRHGVDYQKAITEWYK